MEGKIRLFYFFAILGILLFSFRSCFNDKREVKKKPTNTKPICQNMSARFTL